MTSFTQQSILAAAALSAILPACSSNDAKKGGGAGGTGTLYVNAETHASVYSVDLASGAANKLAFGADPYLTPEGTILCKNTNTSDLGEYSADGTTFRTIVKQNDQQPFDVTYDDNFRNPQLSPDGTLVAYEGQLGYTFDVYVVERQTGKLVAGVNPKEVGVGYTRPTWTPDGRLVLAGGTQNVGLYVADAQLTMFTRFDPNVANAAQPAVSPDGSTVAFVLNDDIYTVKLDGSALTAVTKTTDKESWPTWSPDGKSLAFYGSTSIEIAPAAGGDITDLHDRNDQFFTFTATYDGQITWR